ncbi:uncharacterized protein LOC127115865 [Lathyrus oleraceus]|uniref:uncharacterized protein LOC127115865 n=1 Tax=Pisum sativum TaxID=3888 RepID=UPI0021CE559F|nr:uncharacterized protein LOC127115865 [Pisum sativum]
MERVLADGVWKTLAYNAVAGVLSTRFNVKLNEENIKNHIKLWRIWYRIVGVILGQSGFDWDDTKCMITVKDENAWDEYVKLHEEAKRFRFMVILNWNDIVDICAKDRASGVQVEHAFDVDDVRSKEVSIDEEGSTTKKKMQCTLC